MVQVVIPALVRQRIAAILRLVWVTQHLLGQSRLYNKTLFQRKVRMNYIIGIIINKPFIEHNAILLKAVKSPDES